MNQCVRCDGTGIETFWDGRWERHTCYHCTGTGSVDDEMSFRDKLMKVAHALAYTRVSETKKSMNNNPYGEGWDFCAAENQMTGKDYFDMIVNDYTYIYAEQLSNMKKESQDFLIAWSELPNSEVEVSIPDPSPSYVHLNSEVWDHSDDDLPF